MCKIDATGPITVLPISKVIKYGVYLLKGLINSLLWIHFPVIITNCFLEIEVIMGMTLILPLFKGQSAIMTLFDSPRKVSSTCTSEYTQLVHSLSEGSSIYPLT